LCDRRCSHFGSTLRLRFALGKSISPRATGCGNGRVFPSERLFKAVLGPALLSAWWYFAPDYSKFFSTSLGKLTLGDIGYHLLWMLLFLLCIYHTISWLYEACTGRDSVWLWHRD
jgi:hypothetical protein